MPIYISKDVILQSTRGYINIECENIYSGMIQWGEKHGYRHKGKTRINNRGKIIFRGPGTIISGSEICVWDKAILDIGTDFFIGENTTIYSMQKIEIGRSLRLAYDSQIFDTDFHYTMNINTGEVRRRCKDIIIGDYVWIGNRTTIKKGTKLPRHTIVAGSYSLLSKDYTNVIPEYSIIGGIPAKLISTGYSRTWNNEDRRIADLREWFLNNPNEVFYKYDLNNIKVEDISEC